MRGNSEQTLTFTNHSVFLLVVRLKPLLKVQMFFKRLKNHYCSNGQLYLPFNQPNSTKNNQTLQQFCNRTKEINFFLTKLQSINQTAAFRSHDSPCRYNLDCILNVIFALLRKFNESLQRITSCSAGSMLNDIFLNKIYYSSLWSLRRNTIFKTRTSHVYNLEPHQIS